MHADHAERCFSADVSQAQKRHVELPVLFPVRRQLGHEEIDDVEAITQVATRPCVLNAVQTVFPAFAQHGRRGVDALRASWCPNRPAPAR